MRIIWAVAIAALASVPSLALADEGGVSFWLPGMFGSLAAVPQQPGWSAASIYYHTSVSAGGGTALAREIEIGRVPANVTATLNASLKANVDLAILNGTYVFATPVLGGQASASLMGIYGANSTSLAGALTGTLTTPAGTTPFSRFDSISSTVDGFGDLYPQFTLRWNAGVNNFMTYITGDIPVGAYNSTRLANIGIGHGAIDAGGGYTYFNPQTGHEFSGVLGFTYNFMNTATQYQNGVDMHFDWGASQFLSKQVLIGLVGYVYKEVGCDSGSGDRVGCFQSQVASIGPQIGYIFPIGNMQGYLNLKAYKEFAAQNRPDGWNAWLTFSISPAAPTPSTAAKADVHEVAREAATATTPRMGCDTARLQGITCCMSCPRSRRVAAVAQYRKSPHHSRNCRAGPVGPTRQLRSRVTPCTSERTGSCREARDLALRPACGNPPACPGATRLSAAG